jgi:hypothetical protein
MNPEQEEQPPTHEELPRKGFWATMPKRSLMRVLLLLALLAGIIYLRQRTGTIAGCMENAFRVPPPTRPEGVPLRNPVVLPSQTPRLAPR